MDQFLQFLVNGIMIGGIYGLVALGLVLVYKSSRVLNLAHGSFLMILAWLCWSFAEQLGLPIWLSILLVLVISVLAGLGVERFMLRPLIGQPILAVIIATLALGYLLEGVAIMAWGADTKGLPEFIPREAIWLGPVSIAQHYLWAFGIAILLFVLLYLFFRYTKMGLGMQIVSEDQQVARSLGIRVKNILAQSWAFALVIAAISGILYASLNSVNNGNALIGLTKALPVMLLGGLESLYGALVGGIIVGVFEIVVGGYMDPWVGGGFSNVAPLFLMLVILLIRPYGIFGWQRIERI
ncbi:MAG TPA: branched-chain amino acid ABC transporter permease [Dehalococcoidia bacterium]|jgi:branched-chain amino acid transport system permease protein|nr:branched-chain amino acid ABC transporter permease [Dehalococcoidia bacterium]